MTLVNIDPHVILHQKTHVPRAVNFFESQKASQHPVGQFANYFSFLFQIIKFVTCYTHDFQTPFFKAHRIVASNENSLTRSKNSFLF